MSRVNCAPIWSAASSPTVFSDYACRPSGAASAVGSDRRGAQRPAVFFSPGFFFACRHAHRSRGPGGTGTALSLRDASSAGDGSTAVDRCRPSHLPSQNSLVGWDDPPAFVAVETDRKAGCAHPTPPAQPGALSRRSGSPCPGSAPDRARSARAHDSVCGGGFFRCPRPSSTQLGGSLGARLRPGCHRLSRLRWPTAVGGCTDRSRLDSHLPDRYRTIRRTTRHRSRPTAPAARVGSACLNPLAKIGRGPRASAVGECFRVYVAQGATGVSPWGSTPSSLITTADRFDNRSEGYPCVRSVAIPTANPVHPSR